MTDFMCKICGSPECLPYTKQTEYEYVKCSKCQVISLHPLPDSAELEALYETVEDKPHFNRDRKVYFAELDLTFHDLNFEPGNRPGVLLDIGCANGQFLDYMKLHGWTTMGCDISRQLTAMADKSSHTIFCGDFLEIEFEVRPFDMISMFDIIEHVLNPVAFVERAALLLQQGALLFLQTPCQGILSDAYGENWRRLIPPNHVHLFNFQTLVALLNQHHLAILSWVRWGGGNTAGSVPDIPKRAWDKIAKELGIGDEISLLAVKV